MPNRNPRWYVILGLKVFYALKGIYQASKSTYLGNEQGVLEE